MPCRVGKVLAHLLHAGPGTLAIPCTQDEKLHSSPDERNWTQGRQKRGLSCPSHSRTPIIGAWHRPTRCPAKSRPQPCGCEPHLSKPGRGGGNPGPTPPQQQRTLRPEFPRPRSRPYNWSRTPKRRARRGAGRGPLRLRTPSGFGVPARSPRDLCLAQDGGSNQAWPGPRFSPRPSATPLTMRQELMHTILTQAAPRAAEQVWPKLPVSARPSSLLFLHSEAPIAGAWRILCTPRSLGLTISGANGVWNFCKGAGRGGASL